MPAAPRSHRTLSAMVWLALTVLALGLPQVLIVCHGHDGSVHLEFWHDPADCCHPQERAHAAEHAHEHDHQQPGAERAPGCEHEHLAIGPLRTSRPAATKLPPLQFAAWLPVPPRAPTLAHAEPVAQPPSTGPPPTAALLRQLAATHLLL
ncbi:MAG: hypothetical protein H6838_11680 [Planctomycetes bacterium]|nr:hypothetical protein [Planctomycetota bacterium]